MGKIGLRKRWTGFKRWQKHPLKIGHRSPAHSFLADDNWTVRRYCWFVRSFFATNSLNEILRRKKNSLALTKIIFLYFH